MSNKPTYEELEIENRRLKAKLSAGEDKDFTKEIKERQPSADLLTKYESRGVYIMRPREMWDEIFTTIPSTNDLARLGRSLEAMGWVRSALRGNVVFKMKVEEYGLQSL